MTWLRDRRRHPETRSFSRGEVEASMRRTAELTRRLEEQAEEVSLLGALGQARVHRNGFIESIAEVFSEAAGLRRKEGPK